MVVTIATIVGARKCEEKAADKMVRPRSLRQAPLDKLGAGTTSAGGTEKFRSAGWFGRAPFDKLPSTSSGQAVRSAGSKKKVWQTGANRQAPLDKLGAGSARCRRYRISWVGSRSLYARKR